jgi:hypothetical protein
MNEIQAVSRYPAIPSRKSLEESFLQVYNQLFLMGNIE